MYKLIELWIVWVLKCLNKNSWTINLIDSLGLRRKQSHSTHMFIMFIIIIIFLLSSQLVSYTCESFNKFKLIIRVIIGWIITHHSLLLLSLLLLYKYKETVSPTWIGLCSGWANSLPKASNTLVGVLDT